MGKTAEPGKESDVTKENVLRIHVGGWPLSGLRSLAQAWLSPAAAGHWLPA